MKKLLVSLIAIGCLQFVVSSYAQVPGVINYQGRIVDNGTNFNGTGLFKFALVNSNATVSFWSNDGSSVGGGQPTTNVSLTVTKGLYSVLLGDTTITNMTGAVPASAFTNAVVLLRVWFNDGSTNVFQQLSPDQRIAAAGYALVANSLAPSSSGIVYGSGLDIGSGNSLGGSYSTIAGGVDNTIQPNATYATIGGGQQNTIQTNAHYATIGGGLDSTIQNKAYNSTIGGGAFNVLQAYAQYATIGGGMYNTIQYAGFYATIGGGLFNTIQTNADYATIGGGDGNTAGQPYSTVPGGENNLASGTFSFAAGQQAQALHQGAFVWADSSNAVFASTGNNQFLIRAQGGVGIGTTAPEQSLSVHAGLDIDVDNVNSGGNINNGTPGGNGLTFGSNSGEGIASDRIGGTPQSYSLAFYSNHEMRMMILNNGYVGINTSNAQYQLEVNGNYAVIDGANAADGDGAIDAYIGGDGSGSDVQIGSMNTNITGVAFWNHAAGAWMHISCSSITIEGGSDLAEPFSMSAADNEIPQGAVVVIDDENPGRLKISSQPYDTRVAGVVSGANGIKPGIQMQQPELLGGGKNVALTGRVYVQADASYGPIKAGDLLTTSGTPGCAMKVSDHSKAQGAVLGKAMTGLNAGRGLVLVLVTLQ